MPARHDTCLIAVNQQIDRVRLEHFGSGILLRLCEQHFLLSAAHVLTGPRLWLPGKPAMPLDEAGRIFSTSPFSGPADDSVDLAYVLLKPAAIDALVALGRTFLEPVNVCFATPPFARLVCVFSGMPCSSADTLVSRQELVAQPTYIRGEALSDEELIKLGRDTRLHIGIHYDREKVADDDTGKRVTGPIPFGMSGGPVWVVLPEGTPILVAIGTFYDPTKKVLLGTKSGPLLSEILRRHSPPPTSLHYEGG